MKRTRWRPFIEPWTSASISWTGQTCTEMHPTKNCGDAEYVRQACDASLLRPPSRPHRPTTSSGSTGISPVRRRGVPWRSVGEAKVLRRKRLREVAAEKGITPSQLALAWVPSRGQDIAPIPGTKRVRYLEENVAVTKVELTKADLERIEAAVPKPKGVTSGQRPEAFSPMPPRRPCVPSAPCPSATPCTRPPGSGRPLRSRTTNE
jgi:hypothetical protein